MFVVSHSICRDLDCSVVGLGLELIVWGSNDRDKGNLRQ